MSYCSGEDADVRAYEAMYNNQFGNGVLEEYIPSQELHHEMVQSDDLVSLQEIQVGLEQILSDTDDFDSWAGAIRDRMTEKRMSPPTRAVAVHMISEMAVFVAPRPLSGNSPQHTLARLLNYLCTERSHMDASSPSMESTNLRKKKKEDSSTATNDVDFSRAIDMVINDQSLPVHLRAAIGCVVEIKKQLCTVMAMNKELLEENARVRAKNCELENEIPSLLRDTVLDLLCDLHGKRNTLHPEHKINLCIFFAEVYEKIELDSGNRIDKVGEALLEQLDDLLKLDMSDSLMKTVVQLVKLCGWHLDASSVTEPLVNQLLTKMVAFAKGHPQLSEMMKNQIMSVVEVRKNGWGGNTRTNASGPDAVPSSSSLSFPRNDSGLIVGEDGVALELNEEERSFLESQFNAMDGLDDAEHDHSFDEQEVLKDFGDFVKEEEERKTSSMMEKLKVCEKDDV
ncbi:hypothetical protein Q1695_011448 [Nippostrongylus brasiliensis]|nr:hypothetical protein Q1695_011448 [Nippostrongylus brasiliensis]